MHAVCGWIWYPHHQQLHKKSIKNRLQYVKNRIFHLVWVNSHRQSPATRFDSFEIFLANFALFTIHSKCKTLCKKFSVRIFLNEFLFFFYFQLSQVIKFYRSAAIDIDIDLALESMIFVSTHFIVNAQLYCCLWNASTLRQMSAALQLSMLMISPYRFLPKNKF